MNEAGYKKAIASALDCNPENVFLYWKGRVALYALLKAMEIKKGDEVIIPAFTCVVVPNAVLYLGAKPVYIDISPVDYNSDISKMEEAVTPKTKAIVCQNTFGLSSNIERITDLAKKYNLYTIEDCTHGFGGYYNGKSNGSYCDAAFFSTQWNKPFSTGIGGISLVNNSSLIQKVKQADNEKLKPSLKDKSVLSFLIPFRRYFVNRYTHSFSVKLYRFLSRKNFILGSTQGNELTGIKIPDKYFKGISSVQINAGMKELKRLKAVNNLRKKNAADYTKFLKLNNKTFVKESLFENHLFLKYPLLVKNRELFFQNALKEKINLGDWFISPLHPVKGNLNLWVFDENRYPVAVSIAKKIVNLPTDIRNNHKVLDFLGRNIDMIE